MNPEEELRAIDDELAKRSSMQGMQQNALSELDLIDAELAKRGVNNVSPNLLSQPTQTPQPEQYGEDFGEKSLAAGLRPFANEATAGAVGALPDLVGLGVNAEEWTRSKLTGSTPNYMDSVTDKISDFLNQGLSEKEKLGNVAKYSTRFLSSLFGLGYAGKGAEAIGKGIEGVKGLSQTGKALEKTGSFVSKNLGMTEPSLRNIGAATAAGATAGFSKDANLPAYVEIPAVLFAFMFGGGAGGKADKLIKPLLEKVPGLEKFLQKQNFQELAQQVNPEVMGDLLKNSLLEGETEFLAQKTLSELPAQLQQKVKETPQLLNEEEINLVLKKGMDDYQGFVKGLEQEYGINLTAGEFTASPKVIAKEDALANKPDIETFDTFTKNRRSKIVRWIEKIKHDLSPNATDKTKLGETISQEVDKVYKEAYDLRRNNWNKAFGNAIDEKIIPISNYTAKLKEFSQLRPDTAGNEIAIKIANKKLKDGVQYEAGGKISPKRMNDILVGNNEDLMRFPDRTFSRKQVGELKKALESDVDAAIQNSATAEQGQIIRNAREGYKTDSQIINSIDESVLFNKIDKGSLTIPEKVSKSLENMEPSQIKLTMDALKRSENYNEVIPEVQKYVLEQALKAATKSGVESFNPRLFLQNLPEKQTFNLIFEGNKSLKEIKDISVLLKRIWKNEPVRGNSKTFQRAQADRGDIEESVFKAGVDVAKGRIGGALSTLGEAVGKKNSSQAEKIIAEILISPEKRQEILKYVGKELPKNSWKAPLVQEGINKKEREGTVNFDASRIPRFGKLIPKLGSDNVKN